jgi:hypothetical protein
MDSRVDTYRHIQTVQRIMGGVIADLQQRQQVHDQSKLVSPEVGVFDEFTSKLAGCTYGSDEYKSFLAGMKPALDHHYCNNRHHPEYFAFDGVTFYPDAVSDGRAVRRMSLLDLLEMLCDWKAATMRHNDGDIRRSIEINQKRFGYSDELKQILLNTLSVIEPA